MDPRIREHAEIIVDHSTSVEAGDNVVVSAPPVAEDLLVAVFELLGDRGANPRAEFTSSRSMRAYARAREEFETPTHDLALAEATDVFIHLRADSNATEISDVPGKRLSALQEATKPVKDERLSKRWCLTQFPAPANAQLAEMSTDAYENFVWDAIVKDWDAQRAHQAQLVELLDPADEVRIVSGEETDISMSVSGMDAINDYGRENLPGGEVFTAPVADSVEGTVLFDKPLMYAGREIQNPYLEFEDGEVIDHTAEKNEDLLTEMLNTDNGARRLGELGIGMNRDIDRFTKNMLFDEKMGDTVHLAVGMAYEECGGENESAIHMDMIVDMVTDSFMEIDGDVVQRNGRFVFEDGFED